VLGEGEKKSSSRSAEGGRGGGARWKKKKKKVRIISDQKGRMANAGAGESPLSCGAFRWERKTVKTSACAGETR